MARLFVFTLFVATLTVTAQSSARERFVLFQPTSPSDQPRIELPTPEPTIPSSPAYQQPLVQKSYIVQKSGGCCPAYCVTYHGHRKWRQCCGYCTPMQMIVAVPDPIRCGCAAEVCITIPSCCTGAPCVTSKVGLFGRGIVIYKWPSGQMVQVIFKKHVPDVMVHTFY